jgi:saccharopine dehydrogenase (NAD+, L-lysine-forming)
MSEAIQEAGCCFITDGGFHPGLPALMVRFIAQYFDHLVSAKVGSVIKQDWESLEVEDATVFELVELMNDYEMSVFKQGKWQKVSFFSMSDMLRMDFEGEFGKQYCAPMMLAEMRALPVIFPSLMETGFYVGGFNWFVDWIIMPLAIVILKLWPHAAIKTIGKWMHWGLKAFSRPPYGTLLKVEAVGKKGNLIKTSQATISHQDGYLLTAIPVAACLLQYLDGSIDKPGLWMQAHIVEPNRFMSDMQHMGINVRKVEGGRHEVEPEGN